jgi:hypothetical protein
LSKLEQEKTKIHMHYSTDATTFLKFHIYYSSELDSPIKEIHMNWSK